MNCKCGLVMKSDSINHTVAGGAFSHKVRFNYCACGHYTINGGCSNPKIIVRVVRKVAALNA